MKKHDCETCEYYRLVEYRDGTTEKICVVDGDCAPTRTEEEWLRNCSTEELRSFFDNVTGLCFTCGRNIDSNDKRTCRARDYGYCIFCNGDEFNAWLKQEHKEVTK